MSADSKKELSISAELRKRLHAIPTEVQVMAVVIPIRAVYLAVAGFALLITMNILAMKDRDTSETQKSELYTAYFSYLDQL